MQNQQDYVDDETYLNRRTNMTAENDQLNSKFNSML